jgi:hypothetical protein
MGAMEAAAATTEAGTGRARPAAAGPEARSAGARPAAAGPEGRSSRARPAAAGPEARPRPARVRPAAGPDRLSVALFTTAAFLAVLALLAWQLRASPAVHTRPVSVVRRVYETTVVETVIGPSSKGGGSSVTQSVSSSGSYSSGSAARTRTS